MPKASVSIAMCIICLALSSGCAAWTDKSKSKDSMWSSMKFWKKPYQKPNKLAAIWTHDILTMSGKPPTRGFGGRLYFYNEKSQAIPVDGELHVHGYEEVRMGLNVQAEKTKADKTFMFTAEQFTEHFSSSDLGASYSIWIPWDAADGDQKEITLIPTFKGKDGTILQGEPAKLMLPGRKVEDPLAAAAFQHISFQQSQTPTNMGPLPQLSGLRTTTISMPAQMNRVGKDNRTTNTGNSGYNVNNSSVVVHDSTSSGSQTNNLNSNMTYAGTPHAARANAMYAAFANHANANAMIQQASMTQSGLQSNGAFSNNHAPYPSTMPNMLPSQLPSQLPQYQMQVNALPQNHYQLNNPSLQNQGMQNQGLQNQGLQNQGMQNQGLQNQGLQNQGMQNTSIPNMQQPNMQTPSGPAQQQPPQQNLMNQINPGFASIYSPLQPGAVEAAFATSPQFQPFGQGQANLGQVQPAAHNTMQPLTSGQARGQSQVLPGQPTFQR